VHQAYFLPVEIRGASVTCNYGIKAEVIMRAAMCTKSLINS